ncbi:MAG: hypothetical protein KDD82_15980 [Planctomycetes bacterium]|nr:hypothetical protein [Planctomycetota bacterium]
MEEERLVGKINRRDLALIFARAAELNADRKLAGKDLRESLMSQVLDKSTRKAPDESASASDRFAPGGNLGDLSRSVEDLTRTLELDPNEVPQAQGTPRKRKGVLGLETLEELFVREGEVRFDGYMEDIEQQLLDTFENFKTVSREFGISAAEFERGDILGDGGDLLESRRASRLAREASSARIASLALMEAAQKQPVVTQIDADTLNVLCACGVQRQLHLPELPRLRIRCTSCRQVLYTPTSPAGANASVAAQLLSGGDGAATALRVIYDAHRQVYLAPSTPYVAPGDALRLEDGRTLRVESVRSEVQGGRPLQRIEVKQG